MTTRLQNQHWQSFSGEPITGRTPPQTRMMNDVPMNALQEAGVAHAYKLFTDAVHVTPGKYLVQHRTLRDGTRIQMVSNQGNDVVMVWPVGGSGEDFPVSGIGICFTRANGTPAPGWSYKNASNVVFPQPFVLRPIPKKQAGRIVGSGKWAITPVSRLVGGKQLWVSANRRNWLSSFATAQFQQPAATQTQIISSRALPAQELLTVLDTWTATSQDRVELGFSSDPLQLPFSRRGKYLFRGNDTVLLNVVHSTYPPFISRIKLASDMSPRDYAHVMTIDINAQGLKLYRAPYRIRQKLAEENANLAPASGSVYLNSELVTIPITEPGRRLYQGALSAHPDGKRLICMAYATSAAPGGASDGGHINITIADDGAVTYTVGNLGVRDKGTYAPSGSGTWNGDRVRVPRFKEEQKFAPACSTDGGATTPVNVAHLERSLLLDTRTTTTGSGSANTGKTSVWLNRYYYDLSGDTVIEKNTSVSSSSYNFSLTRTHFTDRDPYTSLGMTFETETFTATSSNSYTLTETAQLKARSIVLNTRTITMGQTLTSTGSEVGGPFSAAMSGSYAETQRDILFYDPVNDFIIWLETTTTGTITGSKDMPSRMSPSRSLDVSSLASGTGAAKIVAKFKSVDVAFLATDITLRPPTGSATCEQVDAFSQYSSLGVILPNGESEIAISSAGISMLDRFGMSAPLYTQTPRTRTYTTAGTLSCGTGPGVSPQSYFVNDLTTVTGTWNDLAVVRTGSAITTNDFIPQLGFSYATADQPKNYIQANYATDPVTLSTIVSLTFKGASMPGGLNTDKVWLIAVDDTGARKLSDVIPPRNDADGTPRPIPSDAVIYEKASLNSLVSI